MDGWIVLEVRTDEHSFDVLKIRRVCKDLGVDITCSEMALGLPLLQVGYFYFFNKDQTLGLHTYQRNLDCFV